MAGVGPIAKAGTMNWLNAMNPILAQLSSISQGQGSPTELPWFKGFEEELMRRGQDQDTELIRQAIARGITGNSLAQVLSQSQQGRNQGVLQMIQQMFQGAPEQLMKIGGPISDFFLKHKQMINQAMQAREAQQGSSSGLSSMLPQMIGKVLGGVGGAIVGGPPGAMMGSQIGGSIGGAFGGSQQQSYPGQGTLQTPPTPQIDWSQFMLR